MLLLPAIQLKLLGTVSKIEENCHAHLSSLSVRQFLIRIYSLLTDRTPLPYSPLLLEWIKTHKAVTSLTETIQVGKAI